MIICVKKARLEFMDIHLYNENLNYYALSQSFFGFFSAFG